MSDFLDKMLVSINKGVNTVSEGSKNILEKAKLNTRLKELDSEKAQLFQNLGVLAYRLQSGGQINVEEFDLACGNIAAAEAEAARIEEDIKKLERPEPQPEPQPGGVACSCGYVNKVGSKFCAGCGRKLI